MRYLTARKRAEGKGAAGTGTEHFWYMKLSGVGLALIIPVFLVAFGRALGGDRRGLIIAVTVLSYGLIATGLFALAKIAL